MGICEKDFHIEIMKLNDKFEKRERTLDFEARAVGPLQRKRAEVQLVADLGVGDLASVQRLFRAKSCSLSSACCPRIVAECQQKLQTH